MRIKLYLFATVFLIGTSSIAGRIEIEFENIDPEKGSHIRIGLYREQGFPEEGKQAYSKAVEIEGDEAHAVFEDIPAGTYAIACYQDSNGNKKLDRGIFNIPKEPCGFSRNKFRRFGPPSFSDVCFDLEEDEELELEIKLKH